MGFVCIEGGPGDHFSTYWRVFFSLEGFEIKSLQKKASYNDEIQVAKSHCEDPFLIGEKTQIS